MRWVVIFSCLLSILACATNGNYEGPSAESSSSDEDWFTYYYMNPEPEKLAIKLRVAAEEGLLDGEFAGAPFAAFMSRVIADNPEYLDEWEREFSSFSLTGQAWLYWAVWLSDTNEGRLALSRVLEEGDPNLIQGIERFTGEVPFEISEIDINSPAILDMLWGAYFASGDEKYVLRIFSVLEWDTDKIEAEGNTGALVIQAAAQWSVTANSKQHKAVHLLHEREFHSGASLSREASGEWLTDGKPDPDETSRKAEGGFGADLLVVSDLDETYRLWELPTAGVRIPTTDVAIIGKQIGIVIVFSGCQADPAGNCRAETNFRILNPDGEVHAEHNSVLLWQYPPPPESHLQLSKANLALVIEPTDPLGRYRVEAVVTDLVSGVKLRLETSFTAKK